MLGAIEVTYPGRVWLNKELSDQAKGQASCLFVGLMLYQPPSQDRARPAREPANKNMGRFRLVAQGQRLAYARQAH